MAGTPGFQAVMSALHDKIVVECCSSSGGFVADSPISGFGVTIEGVFSSRRYRLDTYQREFSWTRSEVRRLVYDLRHRFMEDHRPTYERRRVAEYAPYFLGSFVYHEDEGITYIVDGQQRISTLHLFLIFLQSLLRDAGLDGDADGLNPLIKSTSYGQSTFTIDISDRADLLEHVFRDDDYILPANAPAGSRRLWEAADELETIFPEDLRDEALPYFVDWLLNRVCMVGIKAASRAQGWEIYEGVNDRGVRLGPLDLLKSLLLRSVSGETAGIDNKWRAIITDLAAVDPNAPTRFLKSFFVGRYAQNIEDAARIDELYSQLTDNPVQSGEFYGWFRDSVDRLGIKKQNQYRELIDSMSSYARHYCMLERAAQSFSAELPHLFFNRYNRIGGQFATVIAAVDRRDDPVSVKEKAELVGQYLDLVFVWRFLGGLPVTEDDLAAVSWDVIHDLRKSSSMPARALRVVLAEHVRVLDYAFTGMGTLGLQASNKRQIRYLLGRLTSFVAVGCNKPDDSGRYLAEDVPFEIEHIWANKFDRYQAEVGTRQAFDAHRNRLGALVLLPKSDNSSYRDRPFDEKVSWYQRQNDLAASLHRDHRNHNAPFNRFVRENKLEKEFRGYSKFNVDSINERQDLYKKLCERIWSPEKFGVKPVVFPRASDPAARRTRAHYAVAIKDLIDVGVLAANQKLTGRRRGRIYEAQVMPDGRVKLPTGEVFGSLSAAGQFVLGTKSCQGWSFWKARADKGDVALVDIRQQVLESGLLEQPSLVGKIGR
ncbi:GmrSD restriction endonuclease domain-containing protein [Nocardia carnea]|uniref:GmrSD restriction endonuclease domain-containing protein n=2 Tax=Nocardia carnea TaxID=37328 RepID=UPI0032B01438